MCYSAEVSAGTFGFVFLIAMYLWLQGTNSIQRAIAVCLVIIASMQLVEFGLWMAPECGMANKVLTTLVPITLYLQPVLIHTAIGYFNAGWLDRNVYLGIAKFFTLLFPLFLIFIAKDIGKCTTVDSCGHLAWPALKSDGAFFGMEALYHMLMILALGTLKNTTFSIFYLVLSAAGYFVSKKYYRDSWGSVWCHFVNALAVGAVFT
jgi:hypothetical protein